MAAPKFFKIVLDPTLRIPPEFMKRMGYNLRNPIFLKVTSGPTMEVELVQSSDGQTTLQKGWKEFRERYSIDIGHLLVFEYTDKSVFNVVVFDKSAVEINYPVNTDENGKSDGAKNQQTINCCRHDDVIKISSSSCERDSKPKLDESSYEESLDGIEMQGAVAKETSVAYQRATDFVCRNNSNNPSFISLLQQSYVSGGFILNVALSFARRNFPGVGSTTIILVMGGKKWRVRCNVRNKCTNLSAGWKQFVRDNGLKVGDACVFQVPHHDNTEKHVWNVAIFRSSSCD